MSTVAPHPELLPATRRPGHSWAPASPCGPHCLPPAVTLPRLGPVRVALRLAGVAALVLGTGLAAVLLPLLGVRRRARVLRLMFRAVLRMAGVRLVVSGDGRLDVGAGVGGAGRGGGGALVVANHLSWLDVLALGAVQPMRMVAKREIRDWPVIGALAARVGTLFVDRAGLRELPSVVAQTAEALREGSLVGLFPEGTTWCGAASGVFYRAGFQAAIDGGVPVRPVAQRMRLPGGGPTTVGAFIGDDTLLDSLLRVVRLPGLVLEVEVLPPLVADAGTDRRELARRAELAIAAATGVPAPPAPARTPATARRPPARPARVAEAA